MIVIGTTIDIVKTGISFKPGSGYMSFTIYEGTREACEGFAAGLSSAYQWEVEDIDPPKSQLRVTAPFLDDGRTTPEAPIDLWELHGNAIQKDLYEHPASLDLGTEVIGQIKAAVATVQKAEIEDVATVYGQQRAQIKSLVPPADLDQALTLFDLELKDTKSYQVSQYVLRHTRTVGTNSGVQLSFAHIEQLYTAAQIVAETSMPSSINFTLANIPTVTPPSGYFWGWLKQTPTCKQVAGNKLEIVNEWWLETWSLYIYSIVT